MGGRSTLSALPRPPGDVHGTSPQMWLERRDLSNKRSLTVPNEPPEAVNSVPRDTGMHRMLERSATGATGPPRAFDSGTVRTMDVWVQKYGGSSVADVEK